jgi:hypothetical protein
MFYANRRNFLILGLLKRLQDEDRNFLLAEFNSPDYQPFRKSQHTN